MLRPHLKFFCPQEYLSSGEKPEIILAPFLGAARLDQNDPDFNRFEEYEKKGREYFFLVNKLEDCDLALWPTAYRPHDEKIKGFVAEAKKFNKPVVFFFNNDSVEKIDLENSFIFRTSFYRSKKSSQEFAVPGFSEDFVENYFSGSLPLRAKKELPTVGYCGYASKKILILKIKSFFKIAINPGLLIRSLAIKKINGSRDIIKNFIIRDNSWWGGALEGRILDYEKIKKVRREFVDNIVSSDYVLCARGGGNFSYRLSEALSLGRIPVFINTDCVLPYETEIDWKKVCLWIEVKDQKNIARRVIEHYNSLTEPEFIAQQKRCREIWEEYLSPNGYFKNFYKHFSL